MSSNLRLKYATLDVFTKEPYTGNQLAIVRVPKPVTLSQDQKQKIAQEFNYSESVILRDAEDDAKPLDRHIRIFLRNAEIPFAGHPTIGAACFLGNQHSTKTGDADEEIHGTLQSKVGPIPFIYRPSTQVAELKAPHDIHVHSYTFAPKDLTAHGFSQQVSRSAPSVLPFVSYVKGVTFCVINLPSVAALGTVSAPARRPEVDGRLNSDWHPDGALVGYMFYVDDGIVEGPSGAVRRLRTRMIAGSFEDAATGSASCALAAYLSLHDPDRTQETPGPWRWQMTQGVEMGRKSLIGVEVTGDQASSSIGTVKLQGSAVQIMEGSMVAPV